MVEHLDAIGIGIDYKKEDIPCEICGGTDFLPLQKRGRIGRAGDYGPLLIAICTACGYTLQNPRYEDRFYQDYYRQRYREVAFGETKPSATYLQEQRTRGGNVLSYLAPHASPPGAMLDHGCASGATMLPFRDAGWETFGIDPHRPSVETGIEEYGLDIREAGGEKVPFDDGFFDLVMSLGSLEHVYDLDAAMTECHRILKDGGCLLIRWRSNVMWGSPYEYYNHNHYRFFTRNTWTLALLRYGFRVIEMTDREIEGNTGAEYIVAQKAQAGSLDAVHDALHSGERDDAVQRVKALENYKRDFAGRCEDFLAFVESVGENREEVVKAVQDERVKYRLLWGDPAVTVPRALLEAKRFLDEFAVELAGSAAG